MTTDHLSQDTIERLLSSIALRLPLNKEETGDEE